MTFLSNLFGKEFTAISIVATLVILCLPVFAKNHSLHVHQVCSSNRSYQLEKLSLQIFYLQPVASTINTLAGALYKVFSASPDKARNEMRQACFDYLSLGGVFSDGPVSLLSGLNPRPLSLVCHFFAVAIYGIGRLMLPFPSPGRIWIGARLISVCVFLPHLFTSSLYFVPYSLHLSFKFC